MMAALPLAALSLAALGLLAWRDPKRLRGRRRGALSWPTTVRLALLAVALLPGLLSLRFGGAAATLIWAGAVSTGGWLIAETFSRR